MEKTNRGVAKTYHNKRLQPSIIKYSHENKSVTPNPPLMTKNRQLSRKKKKKTRNPCFTKLTKKLLFKLATLSKTIKTINNNINSQAATKYVNLPNFKQAKMAEILTHAS